MSESIIRACKPGEPSLVVHFCYQLFAEQFGFLPRAEQQFLHAMADLFDHPKNNQLFVIEDNGTIVGSVCIVEAGNQEAQIRMFCTAPALRGTESERKLLETAMQFCKENEFHHVVFRTVDSCEDARQLYETFGFQMTDSKPNTTLAASPVTEETWEYADKTWEILYRSKYWETIL